MIEHKQIVRQARFGIEELLRANAKVLYENFFSTRHIGRVLDFMFYEAKDAIASVEESAHLEHRIRQILESCIFSGFANYKKDEKTKCVELEFGWDDVRIVVSAAFVIENCTGFLPGDQTEDKLATRIRKLIEHVQMFADEVVVRFDPRLGRFQIIGLLSYKNSENAGSSVVDYVDVSKIDIRSGEVTEGKNETVALPEELSTRDSEAFSNAERAFENERAKLTHIKEAEEEKREAIQARIHDLEERKKKIAFRDARGIDGTEPDVEITSRLKREVKDTTDIEFRDREKPKKGTSINFVEEIERQADEQIRKSKRTSLGEGDRRLIGGDENETIHIRSRNPDSEPEGPEVVLKTEKLSTADEAIVVGKTENIDASGDFMKVKTLTLDLSKMSADVSPLSDTENDDVEEVLQILLKAIRAELVTVVTGVTDDQFEEIFRKVSINIREAFLQGIHHLTRVRNIQLVSKVKHYKEQINLLNGKMDNLRQQIEEQALRLGSKSEEGLGVQANAPSGTAQTMSKGILEEALKEKAALAEKVRQIDDHLRKREFDYKTQEASLIEQVRLKEEAVKQKQFGMDKMKEMLATMMENLERYKKMAASSISEAEMKMKLAASEKLVSVAKDNNEKMSKRADELQKKWSEEFSTRSQAQEELSRKKREVDELQKKLAESSVKGVDPKEMAEVTAARDRATKVAEELRRQNKELQEKLNAQLGAINKTAAAKSGPTKQGDALDAETKHKLEQAAKLNKALQDDLNRQKKRFDDLKLEETKLRVEVAKLQNQLKNAGKNQATANKGFGKK